MASKEAKEQRLGVFGVAPLIISLEHAERTGRPFIP